MNIGHANNGHAVFVLPSAASGRIDDIGLRRWLSRGTVRRDTPRAEMLLSVLNAIGVPAQGIDFGPLRFWGQTGDSSKRWLAAADPVHLETRLRDLRVRAFTADQVSDDELGRLFDVLENELGDNGELEFVRVGRCGYLISTVEMQLPEVSAEIADGNVPDKLEPTGATASAYLRLLGEVQMLLHAHEENLRRQEQGQPTINSLWVWGGGIAPHPVKEALPVLFANDPLFSGYWASRLGRVEPWHSVAACIEKSSSSFVAVTCDPLYATTDSQSLAATLQVIARFQKKKAFRQLTLLFRDGLTVRFNQFDQWRFWRKQSVLVGGGVRE